jgi:lysophospholipase L1-like esterase
MERILIRVYGDSLAMPREGERIAMHETFPELLRAKCEERLPGVVVHVANRSRGAATISSAFELYVHDSGFFGPGTDVLIIQIGIVDCAPRPIPRWLKKTIGIFPGRVQRPIIDFLHNNRRRIQGSGFVFRETPPKRFAAEYRRLLQRAARECRHVYVINMPPTTAEMDAHSPGFAGAILRYNDILGGLVRELAAPNVHLIDVYRAVTERQDGLVTFVNQRDGHHITHAGHDLYAELIFDDIRSVIPAIAPLTATS